MSKRKYQFVSIKQERFIAANYEDMSNSEIGLQIGLTAQQVRGVGRRLGLKKPKDFRMKPGWNKGMRRSDFNQNEHHCKKTQFKKRNVPHNILPVGSMRFNKDGIREIKIEHPRKWISFHKYVYEKEFGTIEKNKIVIFKPNADRENFTVSDLLCITRAELLAMNRQKNA